MRNGQVRGAERLLLVPLFFENDRFTDQLNCIIEIEKNAILKNWEGGLWVVDRLVKNECLHQGSAHIEAQYAKERR